MFTFYFICIFLISGSFANAFSEGRSQELNLMPVPAHINLTGDKFRLNASFKMAFKGNADKKLYTGATRVLRILSGRTGLFFLQDFLTPDVVVDSASLVIESKRKVKVELAEDESYMLWVSTSVFF